MSPAVKLDSRRRRVLGAGAAAGLLALTGCASAPSGPSIGRVASSSRRFRRRHRGALLRLWGGNVDVTLVERNAEFVSCPVSNMVLGGHRTMAQITLGYGALRSSGVKVIHATVVAIDAAARQVRLADGATLNYDRLIVAPGVDFDASGVGGFPPRWREHVVHAWKRAQTLACGAGSRPCRRRGSR